MKTILYTNNIKIKQIVISITLVFFLFSNLNSQISKISSQNIKVDDFKASNNELEELIKPYKKEIIKLQKKIGFSTKSLSIRDGELEYTLGNLIADILLEESNNLFKNKFFKNIDFCLLNYGGIRGTLNKGVITQHDLVTIMPFNNLSTVVKISGNKVQELFQYLNNDNKQHPVSGLKIIFNEKKIQNVLIQNKKFNINKSYYVLTSNFLQEGGDKMDFFINPLELYNLETNIREVLIKHITMKKKIEVKLDNRIQRIK